MERRRKRSVVEIKERNLKTGGMWKQNGKNSMSIGRQGGDGGLRLQEERWVEGMKEIGARERNLDEYGIFRKKRYSLGEKIEIL